ncbi:MAG: hypothetical protein AB1427_16955 [Thermodesulfobacteriota bacterium]
MYKETFIISIWAFGALFIITGIAVYTIKVIPTLEKYGQKVICSGLPSEQFKQWREYKKICVENGLPLTYWRILIVSQIAAAVVLILWITIFLTDVYTLSKI